MERLNAVARHRTASCSYKTVKTSASTTLTRPTPQIMEEPRIVYTLRATPNTILAVTPKLRKTAVLGFKDEYSAYEFGRLLEAHRLATKEWPDLSAGNLHLYDNGNRHLRLIDIIEWELEDLKRICATRYLNMILVDDFFAHKNLRGTYLVLGADTPDLVDHLNYLWSHHIE